MKFRTEAELIIIGTLYEQPEVLFTAGELCGKCLGKLTPHQIGYIMKRLDGKGFIQRKKVVNHGWQTRYGANEEIISEPDGNKAQALYEYLASLFPSGNSSV